MDLINVSDSNQVEGDQQSDSFLCSLGRVETPTKEQSHQSPFVTIIEKLSDNITMLTNLLNTERTKNTNLLNENRNLKIDIEQQRATVQGGFPYSPSTTINNEKLQPLKVDQKTFKRGRNFPRILPNGFHNSYSQQFTTDGKIRIR